MSDAKQTILITSAGSLVGKVVLDALEGRRGRLQVAGINTVPEAPNLFRCDEAFMVPGTEAPGWRDAFLKVFRRVKPFAVIPGRDLDVEALAALASGVPELREALIGGPPEMAAVIGCKQKTAEFSRRHGLPYVETAATGCPETAEDVRKLAARHGYPLIAKPVRGSGSHGVRVLTGPAHLEAALRVPDCVVQPFLDPPPGLGLSLEAGLPLFWEVPETRLYGVQHLILRNGTPGPAFGFHATMVRGRLEDLRPCRETGLMEAGRAFAVKAAGAGWRGPFNVQCKRAADGSWRVIELNGRFTGGTSSRRHLGFDEVAWVLNDWAGQTVVPADRPRTAFRVMRFLSDFPLESAAVEQLRRAVP